MCRSDERDVEVGVYGSAANYQTSSHFSIKMYHVLRTPAVITEDEAARYRPTELEGPGPVR